MVDLLFIAHEQACETELAHLLSADLDAGRVPDPVARVSGLTPRHMALPADVTVAHPSTKSRMDAKLHAVTDADGRPISVVMTAGQVDDETGAAARLGSLPKTDWLLADRS